MAIKCPYIPWVPDDWNGLLVLAEAQNLSNTYHYYREQLLSKTPTEQICRLYELENGYKAGIKPWDDGSLKLAVEVIGRGPWTQTAVSNAVLWSQTTSTGGNQTPEGVLLDRSAKLWTEMLAVLRPKYILSAGKVARKVVAAAGKGVTFHFVPIELWHPSAFSRVSGTFDSEDLLRRYPEVASVTEQSREWLEEVSHSQIFFACHAVSLCGNPRSAE